MDTPRITRTTPTARESNIGARAPAWRVGDILHAQVMERLPTGATLLRIGDQTVKAETSRNLPVGSPMRFRVVSLDDIPVLNALAAPDVELEAYLSALRTALPKQHDLLPALRSLEGLLDSPSEHLPPNIKTLLTRLLDLLPAFDGKSADAEQLRNALAISGQFLEAHLAAHADGRPADMLLQSDFKAAMLRLSALVKAATLNAAADNEDNSAAKATYAGGQLSELAHYLDAVLAKIEWNQLQSLTTTAPDRGLLMDLPIRYDNEAEIVKLRVNADEHQDVDNSENGNWSISLTIDLREMGCLHARVRLNGLGLSATLWAEDSTTCAILERELSKLEQRFVSKNLPVQHLQCLHGKPADPVGAGSDRDPGHALVDVLI